MRLGLRISKEPAESFSARVYAVSKSIEKAMDRGRLVLVPVTDKNGHKTKRWMSPEDAQKLKTGKPEDSGAAEKKLGIRSGNGKKTGTGQGDKPQPGASGGSGGGRGEGKKPAIGEAATGKERGTGNPVAGKVTAAGKDGITVLSGDGTAHAVEWAEVESVAAKSKGYITPENFNAAEWSKQWADPKATPDDAGVEYILDSFEDSDELKQKINWAIEENKRIEQAKQITSDLFRINDKEGVEARYIPEREALHGRILQKVLSPDKMRTAIPDEGKKPRMLMLGGRGGSGKSWFKNNVYDPDKFVVLDADAIKEEIPEYKGWNANQVHNESADILEQAIQVCKTLGLNVVLDMTMKTKKSALARMELFKEAGHRTEAHYMHLPVQEAAKRAIARYRDGNDTPNSYEGRFVPVGAVLSMRSNEETFNSIKDLVDDWSFRDNNVERGEQPILISEKNGKKLEKSVFVIVKNRFKVV